jgi:hypothetical protein
MKQTENFSLNLFEGTDKFDYEVMNENWQNVDDTMKSLADTMQENKKELDNDKANKTDLTAHTNNADIHVTASDKMNWDNATDKINNLEVGGRNLLVNTIDDIINDGSNDTDNYNFYTMYTDLKIGETYTFSAELTVEGSEDKRVSFAIFNQNERVLIRVGELVADSKRHSITFEVEKNTPNLLMYTGVYGSTAGVKATCHHAKLEKGNVATDWTPALEDKIEIADVNGLQDITNNNQYTKAHLASQGWYRIAKYKGSSTNEARGVFGNSCDIIIKRMFMNQSTEEHRLLLKSRFQVQKFVSISNFSYESNIINKIRYVYDSTSAYIDIYYNAASENPTAFMINNGRDFSTIYWETVSPYLVDETIEGETVSTVFDIPANANPVTDLDLVKMSGVVKTIDVDSSYIWDDVVGGNTGKIGFYNDTNTSGKVADICISASFFGDNRIDVTKVLAIAFNATGENNGQLRNSNGCANHFVWNPMITQTPTGRYEWRIPASLIGNTADESTSFTVNSCKLLYMS